MSKRRQSEVGNPLLLGTYVFFKSCKAAQVASPPARRSAGLPRPLAFQCTLPPLCYTNGKHAKTCAPVQQLQLQALWSNLQANTFCKPGLPNAKKTSTVLGFFADLGYSLHILVVHMLCRVYQPGVFANSKFRLLFHQCVRREAKFNAIRTVHRY